MTTIDMTRPVWNVRGKIPDGRYMTCFVNADNEKQAAELGMKEGIVNIERCVEIDPETGLRKTK